MTRKVPGHQLFDNLLEYLASRNHCEFKDFYFDIDATRMSGEMCTSLGNGFTNLMLMLYALYLKGIDIDTVDGCVEGDDGLFVWDGPTVTKEEFREMGFELKLEYHDDLSTASFCGLIFDPEEQINITDPVWAISEFGWVGRRYIKSKSSKLKQLLRSKALSFAYQYPGCPVISSLAKYGLRVTEGFRALFSQDQSQFHRERMEMEMEKWDGKGIPDIEPGINTRLLMEKQYGISIETQLAWEKYFDELEDLQVLNPPNYDLYVPDEWIQYYWNYCIETNLEQVLVPAAEMRV